MARKIDPTSVRQRGFKLLNGMKTMKRENAISTLKQKFNIGDSYAATIYASHRTLHKEDGTMGKAYSVHDMRDGKSCMPYMRVENTFVRPKGTHSSPSQARAAYSNKLERRIKAVKKL